MPIPCDMCFETPGEYYYGEGETGTCFACDGLGVRNIHLPYVFTETIRHLWHIKPAMPQEKYRNSYGSKARMEDLLGFYVSNEQFIETALAMAIPHVAGSPNYTFAISPKFPREWLGARLVTRPCGARKDEWKAYREALAFVDEQRADWVAEIDLKQEALREQENEHDPILRLTTVEEKLRYALGRVTEAPASPTARAGVFALLL